MAEALGLGLAIAGIVDPTLNLIDKISTIVKNCKRFGSDAQSLRLQFEDEDRMVKSSLSFLFGKQRTADGGVFILLPRDTQLSVVLMIKQLEGRLKDYEAVESKYNLTTPSPGETDRFDLEKFLSTGNTTIPDDPRTSDLQSKTSWWKRFYWSTSDKKRLESLIEDLSGWNQRLRRIVQDVIWMGLLTVAQIQSIEVDPDAKALGFGPSARMRRLIVSGDPTKDPKQNLVIPYHKVKKVRSGVETLSIATIDNSPVILEYKNYDLDNRGEIPEITQKQVRQLTAILNGQEDSGFRVLPCRGYFNDRAESRFGFVFDVPAGASSKPITLNSALNVSSSRSQKPSVTTRLKLAHKIAESVYLLHTVGWVHKGLRSESIVFFRSNDNSKDTKAFYDAPWMLGFEYSRLESDFSSNRVEDRIERNLYRHWERWGKPTVRSAKIHDIYALGVILLEIGLWQSAKTLSKDGFKSHSSDSTFVRDALRKAAHGRLGFSMGEKFEKLVILCLEGTEIAFGVGSDDKLDTKLQRQFRERVVEVLKLASECI